MATYTVTLQKEMSLSDDPALQPTPVRVVLLVTSVVGFTDKGIFTYIIDAVTTEPEYSNVATPTDIQNYHYRAAGSNDYLRDDNVTKDFETSIDAEDFIESVEDRISDLVNEMKILDELDTPTSVIITSG